MKVAEITRFGGPEVFHLAERPDPMPGPGQVVVRILAASVNPTDLATREHPYTPGLQLPLVPGWDLAGVVTAVGGDAAGYAPGDRVCGMIPFGRIGGRVGAYAEAAAVDPAWLAHLPGNVGFEEGATLPLNALTAVQALAFFHLEPRARLLITGASGGVGGFATSLAVREGLHLIAVAGRDDEAWVRGLGADEVLPRAADLGRLARLDGVRTRCRSGRSAPRPRCTTAAPPYSPGRRGPPGPTGFASRLCTCRATRTHSPKWCGCWERACSRCGSRGSCPWKTPRKPTVWPPPADCTGKSC